MQMAAINSDQELSQVERVIESLKQKMTEMDASSTSLSEQYLTILNLLKNQETAIPVELGLGKQ